MTLSYVVVDDEPWIRSLVRSLAAEAAPGFVCAGEAGDGEAAWDLVLRAKPEIVLTDIRMPGMDGIELAGRMRERGLEAEIVVVSGHDDFGYARDALRRGVGDYLLKPVDGAELAAALDRAARRIEERRKRTERAAELEKEAGRAGELEKEMRRVVRAAAAPCPDGCVPESVKDPRLRAAAAFALARMAYPIGLEDAAAKAGMNAAYFSERFKAEAGVGFSAFLREARLEAAERLMAEKPGLRMAEVAQAVGFEDANYFARVYRRSRGTTPREFRDSGGFPE